MYMANADSSSMPAATVTIVEPTGGSEENYSSSEQPKEQAPNSEYVIFKPNLGNRFYDLGKQTSHIRHGSK